MKLIPLSILSFLICFCSDAQELAVSNTKQNIVFLGIDNPIEVVVENIDCNDMHVSTTNGEILELETCTFVLRPKQTGKFTIEVYKIKRKDTILIGQKFFIAENLPLPTPKLFRKTNGTLSKDILRKSSGIYANIENFEIHHRFIITDYFALIIRDNNIKFSKKFEGKEIADELLDKLDKVDNLIFINIHCLNYDGNKIKLDKIINFTIE